MNKEAGMLDVTDAGRVFPSRWLERTITGAPAFREKGLTLLRGLLPGEVLGGQLPPRSQREWGKRMVPYVILQGDKPLAALFPRPHDGETDGDSSWNTWMDLSPEESEPAIPGVLRLVCPVAHGESDEAERRLRTMLALLLTMPKSGFARTACQLEKLPEGLAGSLLKLDLLREEWTQQSGLRLAPTEFGAECGLVATWRWNGEEVCQGVACHPRSLSFLAELTEDWLNERPGHRHRGPKPLEVRLERMRDGLYGNATRNEGYFADWQELTLEEVVGEETAQSLCLELELSTDVTWGWAGAAIYQRQADSRQAWTPQELQEKLRQLCPVIREERRAV